MRAALLSVGSELLRGDIVDTNSAYLARQLAQLGGHVTSIQSVPDDLETLTGKIIEALQRADFVVLTGGLGPTQDDLTRAAVAGAMDETVFVDKGLVHEVEQRFEGLHRRMPASNLRQAELISSAQPLHNFHGTAPGWFVRKSEKTIITLPGPPKEMTAMWEEEVLPKLEGVLASRAATRSLITFGLGESHVEERLAQLSENSQNVVIATYAKANGVQVHISVRGDDDLEVKQALDGVEAAIRQKLGEFIFGNGEETLAFRVSTLVKERGLTLAAMESATGGELANLITDVEGSSEYFIGGSVAYTRAAKSAVGVSAQTMDEFGLISSETATEMARAIRSRLSADIGVATTGIAGREPVEYQPPGTCFVAISFEDQNRVREIHRPGDRITLKHYFAQCALDLLRRTLESGRSDKVDAP